jgi:dUTP pyrophosphatase
MLQIPVKKFDPMAKMPAYALPGDVGADLFCFDLTKEKPQNLFDKIFPVWSVFTGIAIEIPENYWVMLTPRSSIYRLPAWLSNSVGVIDTGYRGELLFRFRSFRGMTPFKVGDRVGQMILMPKITAAFTEVNALTPSERGSNGFGSTGK